MIIGTAGHIDHGKTSLIRALTGIDTDWLPEEKARGITLDLGFGEVPLRRACKGFARMGLIMEVTPDRFFPPECGDGHGGCRARARGGGGR